MGTLRPSVKPEARLTGAGGLRGCARVCRAGQAVSVAVSACACGCLVVCEGRVSPGASGAQRQRGNGAWKKPLVTDPSYIILFSSRACKSLLLVKTGFKNHGGSQPSPALWPVDRQVSASRQGLVPDPV